MAQMWSATIKAGGRPAAGIAAQICVGGAAQHRESPFTGFPQRGIGADRNAGFEHRRVERRLGAGEFEIGLAEPIQRSERVGASAVPGARQRRLELLEAAQRHARHQLVAVAEMPIGRRRADAGEARGLRESESRRSPSLRSVPAPRGSAPRANCRDDSRAARRARRARPCSSSCKECLHHGGRGVDAVGPGRVPVLTEAQGHNGLSGMTLCCTGLPQSC